jgi:hypothetical protein
MSECVCDQQVDTLCGICSKKCCTEKKYCKQHGPFLLCGPCEPKCSDCEQLGFTYISGYGGSPFIQDNINKEEYYLRKVKKPYLEYALSCRSNK